MKIAILGATGSVGQRIVNEAVARDHSVTAIARDPSRLMGRERVSTAALDVLDSQALENAIRNHAAVISAIGPAHGAPTSIIVDATRAIAGACMKADVRRVIIVNGAGSLEVEPGVQLLSTPDFPAAWRDVALAHREALEVWRKVKELDWTLASPGALLEPGERRGRYRIGHNELLKDERGQSRISSEDFAMAIIDELERGAHLRERVTFAY